MTICFVIPYFYPAWQYGGTPRSAFELARALAGRRHRIRVLTTDSLGSSRLKSPGAGGSRPLPEGVDVRYYRNISNYAAFRYRVFLPPRFFTELREQFSDCDVIHIHEARSTLAVPAARMADELTIPYVISPHGGLKHLGRRPAKKLYDFLWGRRILDRAELIVTLTAHEGQDALEMGISPSRIRELPNILSMSEYSRLPEAGRFKDNRALLGAKLVLFLGRLHRIKGPDVLVHAFRSVQEQFPDLRLILAGPDDGYGVSLNRLIRDLNLGNKVILTGFLDDTEKLEAMVDSEVVVLPSRSEAFPMTVLESLLCKKPVVMSSACGLEFLSEDHGVLRFSSENASHLAGTLAQAFASQDLAKNAIAGRELVLREFAAEAVALRAEAIYEEVLSRRNRPRTRL